MNALPHSTDLKGDGIEAQATRSMSYPTSHTAPVTYSGIICSLCSLLPFPFPGLGSRLLRELARRLPAAGVHGAVEAPQRNCGLVLPAVAGGRLCEGFCVIGQILASDLSVNSSLHFLVPGLGISQDTWTSNPWRFHKPNMLKQYVGKNLHPQTYGGLPICKH